MASISGPTSRFRLPKSSEVRVSSSYAKWQIFIMRIEENLALVIVLQTHRGDLLAANKNFSEFSRLGIRVQPSWR
ncbi:MAG: hypothetical protein ABSF93_19505 [Candidatus Sulfotelmatobacter sp.]